jgi:hypothetical protein
MKLREGRGIEVELRAIKGIGIAPIVLLSTEER